MIKIPWPWGSGHRIKELHQCVECLQWRPPSKLYRLDDWWLCNEPTHRASRTDRRPLADSLPASGRRREKFWSPAGDPLADAPARRLNMGLAPAELIIAGADDIS